MTSNLRGKKITIMGLGEHGGAVGNVRWLHKQGALLTVTDLKSAVDLADTLKQLEDLPNIRYVLGEHVADDFSTADMILRNPAVPRHSKWLKLARKKDIPIEMDSSLFFKYSQTKNVIGVTGSKGKSSCTSFVAQMLRLKYARVEIIGTEGTSPLAALDLLQSTDAAAFELSSWRLEGLGEHGLSPATAIVTSLYPDHLNTYDSYAAYVEVKKNIFKYQNSSDRIFLNYDDENLRAWEKEIKSHIFWFSLTNHIPHRGICVKKGIITIESDNPMVGSIPLFALADLPFQSDHERRNALPAIYMAWSNGVRPESIHLQAQSISTLAHRLERVRILDDIMYINDSAATIPDATIAALAAFHSRHIVLILGGSDKNLEFDHLAEAIVNARIRGIILLPGNVTATIEKEIRFLYRAAPPIIPAKSMSTAVTLASDMAHANDVVLLSPGATSFGLFKHEFDRGEQFRAAVLLL